MLISVFLLSPGRTMGAGQFCFIVSIYYRGACVQSSQESRIFDGTTNESYNNPTCSSPTRCGRFCKCHEHIVGNCDALEQNNSLYKSIFHLSPW